MKKIFIFVIIILNQNIDAQNHVLNDLDEAWNKMKTTIVNGDFRSFKSVYHRDAILVNGILKKTYPIQDAFESWKQGFDDTKAGSMDAKLELKFSQRIFDNSTAHEMGIFHYYTMNSQGEKTDSYVYFESLWVKKQRKWFMLMENQKSKTNKKEWDNFKRGI